MANATLRYQEFRSQESGVRSQEEERRKKKEENYLEAFGELFLAMTDNLSSKCFAPTDN